LKNKLSPVFPNSSIVYRSLTNILHILDYSLIINLYNYSLKNDGGGAVLALIFIRIIQVIIFAFGMYFLAIAAAGLFSRRPCKEHPPRSRFAVIVPAHNEEPVIGKLVRNLVALDYPDQLYDIYVIADHCSDGTATVARREGALVWERGEGRRGKGCSLNKIMDKLGLTRPGPCPYDAAVIIDADNLVALNFLRVMNNRLLEGEKLIQCFIDAKNLDDSWVTAIFSINFWVNNRFIMQSRCNLGLSSLTAGSGVCISREVLLQTGWSTVTITEDLEFAVQALNQGFRATFAPETRVFDEKPVTFSAACVQRLRWARGQLNVAMQYAPRLLAMGLIKRDPARVEGGLRLLQLPVLALGMILACLAPIQPQLFRDTSLYCRLGQNCLPAALFLVSVPYLLPLFALLLDRLPWKAYRFFPFYPVFYLSWILLIFYALFTFRCQTWIRSQRRGLEYYHVQTVPVSSARRHFRSHSPGLERVAGRTGDMYS
jgi:cellulose synthase/poly-beta-1,6-N-acetylglucosamine synthase-like glycosyltransferase